MFTFEPSDDGLFFGLALPSFDSSLGLSLLSFASLSRLLDGVDKSFGEALSFACLI